MTRALLTTAFLAFFSSVTTAETITVCLDGSCDYTDIQDAVDAAEHLDVIEVGPGTYYPEETITTPYTGVKTLRGSVDKNGYPTTIIDGQGAMGVINCSQSSAWTFENLLITGGNAILGGGAYCAYPASMGFDNCVFLQNSASNAGGGLFCHGYENSISLHIIDINNCVFQENSAGSEGGGMSCYRAGSEINNCNFIGNSAYFGGGLDSYNCNPKVTNCIFEKNLAFYRGGGLSCFTTWGDDPDILTNPILTNCVFRDNTAADIGGGMYGSFESNPYLTDTILCSNFPNQIHGSYTEKGDNCFAYSCFDGDGNGIPDKCDETGSETLLVPDEYPTIIAAIMVASNGDIIEIGPGTYVSSNTLDLQGKAITLRGSVDSSGYPTTIVAGQDSNRVFQCVSGEAADTIFANLLITGGHSTNGGGMFCENSNPTINNCVFQGNTSTYGGGLSCQEGNPTLNNCVFQANSAAEGGGLRCFLSSPTLNNCLFLGNMADFSGGGMLAHFLSYPELNNCVIQGNSANVNGGGMYSNPTSSPSLANTILCGNTPEQVYGLFTDNGSNCMQEFCVDCELTDCPTDLNDDGVTDGQDLGLLFVQWGDCSACPADFNTDGEVNGQDLGLLFVAWGPCQ